jgi:hypothetical protein
MSWQITGQCIEACSCKMLCPCFFGPAEPDQGWCSGAIMFDIQQGQANGITLSGRTVIWAFDLPKDFVHGNGTGRLYIDEAATDEQRRELESIFTGKQGGPMAVASALMTTWLPTKMVPVSVGGGDNPTVTVGTLGVVKMQPMRNGAGRPTRVVHAAIHEAFEVEGEDLARSDGTRWSDPDLRRWESGGSGGMCNFSWSV